MPIVQAYKCPKTHKLFEDKAKYVAHLKQVALKSLMENGEHPRISLIQRKFDTLRKYARSWEDIGRWLEAHPRLIHHAAISLGEAKPRISKTPETLKNLKFDSFRLDQHVSNRHHAPINGETNWSREINKPASYAGIECHITFEESDSLNLIYVLQSLASIGFGGGGGLGYDIYMFAEDWPFIGAEILFETRHASKLYEQDLRILQYAFPGMPVDHFSSLRDASVLPDDLVTFRDFIMQYVEHIPQPTTRASVTLPSDVVTSEI